MFDIKNENHVTMIINALRMHQRRHVMAAEADEIIDDFTERLNCGEFDPKPAPACGPNCLGFKWEPETDEERQGLAFTPCEDCGADRQGHTVYLNLCRFLWQAQKNCTSHIEDMIDMGRSATGDPPLQTKKRASKCGEGCLGFAWFETDDGVEMQRCDECDHHPGRGDHT